ncbi:MAG TPA: hypothetical protein DCZ92_06215 [Elusimicrobia bacterium]|nr:MAG: hypothetical protein A2016_06230 [Elusimicrobia bacterium GWF2_62_30]HBA60400.1 hypothetical protein [Elusimicrobiota bacterium]
MDSLFNNAVFMRYALDAVPSVVLVADEDVRVLYRNLAARDLLSGKKLYGTRLGELMHCVHSADVPAGCGKGPHCVDCLVRNSVNSAFSGKAIRRRRADLSVRSGGKDLEIPVLVSVSGFTFEGKIYAMLVIEDISELVELRSLLPICSSCKKIRGENGAWEHVESYINAHIPQTKLSHGLCPDCSRKLYPDQSD